MLKIKWHCPMFGKSIRFTCSDHSLGGGSIIFGKILLAGDNLSSFSEVSLRVCDSVIDEGVDELFNSENYVNIVGERAEQLPILIVSKDLSSY